MKFTILKFFPDSILACRVYLPSTNRKFLSFKIIANPAEPEKLDINFKKKIELGKKKN